MQLAKLELAKTALKLLLNENKEQITTSPASSGSQKSPEKSALAASDSKNKKGHVQFSDNVREIFLPPEARMAAQYLLKLIHAYEIEKDEAVFENKLRSFFQIRLACTQKQINPKYPLYPIFEALAQSIQKNNEDIQNIYSPNDVTALSRVTGAMLAEILETHKLLIDKKVSTFPGNNILLYEIAVEKDSIVNLFPYTEKNQHSQYPYKKTNLSLLAFAVKKGLENVVTMLLKANFDVNKVENGASLIDCALEKKHINIAKLLAQKGAKTTLDLPWAITHDRQDVAIFLIQHGSSVMTPYLKNRTLLHFAAEKGWTEVANICLAMDKFPVEMRDINNHDALHLAVINNHVETARNIMKPGRAVFEQTLTILAKNPKTEIALHIFKKMNIGNILSWTVKNNRADIAMIALNEFSGPLAGLPLIEGREILAIAIKTKGWEQVASILLEKQATPTALSIAVHISAYYNNYQIVKKCLSMNVDTKLLCNGQTLFYSAVAGGNEDIIVLLIQHPNIDLFVPCTNENKKIFDIVRENKWKKAEKALADKGYPLELSLLAKETAALREQVTKQSEILSKQEKEIQELKAMIALLMESSTINKPSESNSNIVGNPVSFSGVPNTNNVTTRDHMTNSNGIKQ